MSPILLLFATGKRCDKPYEYCRADNRRNNHIKNRLLRAKESDYPTAQQRTDKSKNKIYNQSVAPATNNHIGNPANHQSSYKRPQHTYNIFTPNYPNIVPAVIAAPEDKILCLVQYLQQKGHKGGRGDS